MRIIRKLHNGIIALAMAVALVAIVATPVLADAPDPPNYIYADAISSTEIALKWELPVSMYATCDGDICAWVTGYGSDFYTAHDITDCDPESEWLEVNQGNSVRVGAVGYSISRSCLFIDTSALDDDAIIISAYLRIYTDYPFEVDFDIVIVNGDDLSTEGVTTWDYCNLLDETYSYGSINTYYIGTEFDYYYIELNEKGIEQISKTGYTKFGVRSGHDIDRIENVGAEYINFYTNHGTEEHNATLMLYVEDTAAFDYQTVIIRKEGSYPTSRFDGLAVYDGSNINFTDKGLTTGTTYYYQAWGYMPSTEEYSETYVQDFATTLMGEDDPEGPPMPPEWFQTPSCTAYEKLPFFFAIENTANAYSIPLNNFCLGLTLLWITGAGLLSYLFTKTNVLALGVMVVAITVCSIAGLLPMWMLLIAVVLAGGMVFIWQRT